MTKSTLAAAILLGALATSVFAEDVSACQDSFGFPGLDGGSVDLPSFDTPINRLPLLKILLVRLRFRPPKTVIIVDKRKLYAACAGVYLRVDALRNAQADISHPCDEYVLFLRLYMAVRHR